ncbi:hypothetical protein SMICM304S_07560 [Streptomyces microflavus]
MVSGGVEPLGTYGIGPDWQAGHQYVGRSASSTLRIRVPQRRQGRWTATGAASGIGRASAVLLAEAGATVHCADRDETGLRRTYEVITRAGGTARTHPLDVTDRDGVRAAVRAAGELDILVAVAGIMHTSTVLETADDDLDRVLAVNFKGVLYACQEAARS